MIPPEPAAAVFVGIFVGIVPIYGFQLLVAVGLAVFFKLNKPLTVASTFINNPLLQPLIVVSSVEIGYFLRGGSFRPFHMSALAGPHVKEELLAWVMGSVVLGVLVGGVGGAIAAVVVQLKAPANPELRERVRFVNGLFAGSARADRGFVRWKLRLDRIFGLLAAEDLGSGTVVDLGCGYGMALSFAAFGDNSAAPGWLRPGCASHRGRAPGPEHAERGLERGGCSRARSSAGRFDSDSGCVAVSAAPMSNWLC